MNKVQQKSGASKKVARDRRILAKARREDGAEKRAGVKRRPKHDDPITLDRGGVELLVNMLEGAKQSAIEGAIPPRFADAGPEQAIEAYRVIRFVQRDLRRALEGGAS